MAASPNVPQSLYSGKSHIGKSGVLTLYGFGIRVRMQSGHLEIEDGIGPDRRKIRLARVGHGLKRLVLIGSDGFITLEALHWLAAQDVPFVMVARDGKVQCVTGPVCPSDARLRRAQALAGKSPVGVQIARELIDQKLLGQEQVVRNKLLAEDIANIIAQCREELTSADTLERIRLLESRAAAAYWSIWRNLPINFPKKDAPRVPDHWRIFGTRFSPITGSPRLAVNPANAVLNFLYGLLCAESRLAAVALGLDPGLGILHFDTEARDSLACDLMETVRPQVDSFLLDLVTHDLLKREWFAERPDGNCRLASVLRCRLSETGLIWGRAVAPVAEWVAQTLWSSRGKHSTTDLIRPTRLTQHWKRQAQGGVVPSQNGHSPRREKLCFECGATIQGKSTVCLTCRNEAAAKRMPDVARIGRIAGHSPEARAKEGQAQRQQAKARSEWNPASQPAWLTEQFYSEKIRPMLAQIPTLVIAKRIGVSAMHAARIRGGYCPHPRHWKALAQVAGVGEMRDS